MYKFNNENIFTGYIKQLLASFNLPKYRVYTQEQARYREEYLLQEATNKRILEGLYDEKTGLEDLIEFETDSSKIQEARKRLKEVILEINEYQPELNVIETKYRDVALSYEDTIDSDNEIVFPLRMRYIPYIKDGTIQEYVNGKWHKCHATLSDTHNKVHKPSMLHHVQEYSYGQKIPNYTKTLKIQNNVYDTYTHEYLGDYLRFHRDFANINLMPLYNCFSNCVCPKLDISFTLPSGYKVEFNTDNKLYKYYMVPVKFFQDYTIAIDCEAGIEMCCCLYDHYQVKPKNTSHKAELLNISKNTYQCLGDAQFRKPQLYSMIKTLNQQLVVDNDSELGQQEYALKLILKVPVNNKSSIVILEGDYTAYGQCSYTDKQIGIDLASEDLSWNNESKQMTIAPEALANNATANKTEKRQVSNRTIINLGSKEAIKLLHNKLITPLQLLRTNTGESYPFADRLIEYLIGNAVTLNEEIKDNVVRAKTVIEKNCPSSIHTFVPSDGIWEPIMSCLLYKYVNEKKDTTDINHDILGYVDKDVEAVYSHTDRRVDSRTNLPIVETYTIANIDIYDN